jgi:hypothetical protein
MTGLLSRITARPWRGCATTMLPGGRAASIVSRRGSGTSNRSSNAVVDMRPIDAMLAQLPSTAMWNGRG